MPVDPPLGTPAPPPDKLAAFREFFGKPVAVQLVRPYVVIVPMEDRDGVVRVVAITDENGAKQLVGLPDLTTPAQTMVVVRGQLRASQCSTMLVLEQSIQSPRGFIDMLLRPEQVEYLAFVKEVPLPRADD